MCLVTSRCRQSSPRRSPKSTLSEGSDASEHCSRLNQTDAKCTCCCDTHRPTTTCCVWLMKYDSRLGRYEARVAAVRKLRPLSAASSVQPLPHMSDDGDDTGGGRDTAMPSLIGGWPSRGAAPYEEEVPPASMPARPMSASSVVPGASRRGSLDMVSGRKGNRGRMAVQRDVVKVAGRRRKDGSHQYM